MIRQKGIIKMESESIKRMSEFLPEDVKEEIVNSLKEHNIIDAANIKKFTPPMLGLALQRCPETKKLLKGQVLDKIKNLCSELGITGEEQDKIAQLMMSLDEKNKAIVMYIWRNRHAKIRELSKIISSPTDSYTLTRIKEVVNPIAKNILGKPLLLFEENKIDPVTSDKVLFSWWLSDEIELIKKEKGMLDVFDEKNRIRIIAELPNVSEKDIEININNGGLVISANDYCKRIPLFYKVENRIEKTYKNNILEISLIKTGGING